MKNAVYILICSACLAIFGVTTIFLGDILSHKYMMISFLYRLCIALLYALMLRSNKIWEEAIKLFISLPISYLLLQYFWKTKYAVRSLNWVFGGYGKQSAGGNFAGMIQLCVFILVCVIAVFGIHFIKIDSEKKSKQFKIIQICTGVTIGIVIVFVTVILEKKFPSYSSIFGG